MTRWIIQAAALSFLVAVNVFAAQPLVKTVPADPLDRTLRHETFSSRTITLKGVSSLQGPQFRATWDFGDGSTPASFPIQRAYDVSATHVYSGASGTEYNAKLTVRDDLTGESASSIYPIVVRDRSLAVETRVAVDEALWNLHKSLRASPAQPSAWNVLALESQGNLPSGDSSNPYTNTVAQAIAAMLANPDTSIRDAVWFKAIAASGTPEASAMLVIAGPDAASFQNSLGLTITPDLEGQLEALTLAGVGRPDPRWTQLESQLRSQNNFDLGTATLFELVEALRNHHSSGEPSPIRYIQSDTISQLDVQSTTLGQLDWYGAETSAGDTTNGVARVLVDRQAADGSFGDEANSTAMAALILALPGSNSVLNVTSQVTVSNTAWTFNRATGQYRANLTINDTGGQVIPGPINAGILNLPGAVTLVNATGTFNGAPYINFPTVVTMNPSDIATVQLQTTVSPTTAITFNTVVYSGTFPPSALSIACPANSITINTPYSSALVASGGVRLYTYSIGPGSLPHNLNLNSSTGAITGTPDTLGEAIFTANVTDSAGGTPETATASCSISVNNPGQPDLTITKTHTGNFTQGSTGNNYTVTVSNSGLGDKNAGQAVSVTDTPPSGLAVTAMSGTGWTCTTLPTCTRNDVLLASASYPAITVTVSVTAAATSPQVNSISVTTAQSESNSGNNTATDSTTIVQPDLTITKTHTGSFTQGSTGNNYTVAVSNSGLGDKNAGQAVSVTDTPPSGLTVTAMSGTGWTCTTLPTCTRSDVLLASASYPAITVTVSVTAAATSPQVNSISVTTAQSESNSGNNTATDSTTIVQPDLTITKTHTGNFTQGSTGNNYTVTVTNSGTGDKLAGQSVSVTDTPPTGLTVTAMSGTGWTCTTLPTCTRNDVLLASASYPAITVTVSVTAAATSPQVNSISVTTAQSESNSGNNTATDSTVITVSAQPDLTITKTHTGSFTQGSTGNNYTVTVSNSGLGDKNAGQAVSVTDTPPSGLTVTAMSGTGWTCTTLPTCTRSDVLLASASYPAITVTVSVTAAATSPQVNSISVTTAQSESNSGNNTATDSTTIVRPDLTITKTHTGNFTQGSTGNNYTVTVSNSGLGDKNAGQAVSVTDTPPSGLTVTAMSGTGWTCTTLPTCTRNDVLLASASYPAITVTVSVTAAATSPQVNSISVTTAQSESNSANNTATDSTTIVQPDLTITKTHTGNFLQGSTGNNYTVTVTNSGTGDKLAGQSVSVTDAPPTGLTVTAMSGTGWTCTTLPTCTRNDVLLASASYPAITVTVTVAANATSPQVNSIIVTTAQSESNSGNNTATDSTIIEAPPAITSANAVTFAPGKTGQTFTVTTTGLPINTISRTGTLPSGVTFTDNGNNTATIAGTPAAGTQASSPYAWVIGAANGILPNATQNFAFNVVCPAITVSGTSPLNLTFNVAMSATTYTQAGGNGTIVWSITGQPTNLTINSGSGQVSGTPNVTGTFSATVTATDAGGCTGTKAVTVSVGPNLAAQLYTGVGNTQFFIAGVAGAPTTPAVSSVNGLLTSATPAGLVTITGASCSGGAITTDALGRFIFTPNVSASSAACTYTGSSNTGPGSTGPASTTANLTFTLNNRVWYVSHGSAGGHDGRSNSPFADMGGGLNNLDCTGGTATADFIYVAQGTASTTGACALKTNQSLFGAGATLTVGPLTVTGNSANTPTLTGTLSASSATGLTVNGVSMSTGGSTAVNLVNSDGALTFKSISASSGANGIIWNNSSGSQAAGSFTVNGDGTNTTQGGNSSGGTISNMSGGDGVVAGSGIYLNKVANVTLRRMTINGTNQNYGIRGITVNNFTLEYSTLGGTNGTSNTADAEAVTGTGGEGSLRFTNLTGIGAITGSILDGGVSRTGMFHNSGSGTLNLTIDSSIVNDSSTSALATDALLMQAIGTSTANLTVTNSQFTSYRQNAIQTDARGTATMSITISGSTFANSNASLIGAAHALEFGSSVSTDTLVQFNVHDNSFRNGGVGSLSAPSNAGGALVAGTIDGAGKFDGKFVNNTVGVTAIPFSGAGNGADALRLFASGNIAGTTRVTGTTDTRYLVTGNTIKRYGEVGIQFNARQGNSILDATVFGNTINEPGTAAAGAFGAIWANSGALSTDTNTLNIVIGSAVVAGNKNTMQDSDPSNLTDVFLENDSAAGTTLKLYRNNSASGTVAGVITDDNNPTLNLSGFTSGTILLAAGVPPTVP